jgi:L,D-transpeptidase YcbB
MSMLKAALLSAAAFGFLSLPLQAQEVGTDQTGVTVALPAPADKLAVDMDREIEARMRALPETPAAAVTILPTDQIEEKPETALAYSDPDNNVPRGPTADRLFPFIAPVDQAQSTAGVAASGAETAPNVPSSDQAAEFETDTPTQLAIVQHLASEKPDKKLGIREIKDIAQYYEARRNTPIWYENGERTARAEAVLGALRNAEAHGLDVSAYDAPAAGDGTPEAIAAADVALSRAIVAYARDASGARIVNPARLSKMITAKPEIPIVDTILATVESGEDGGAALESFNPHQPGYKALVKALHDLRNASEPTANLVSVVKTLRLGQTDESVVQLRRRLNIGTDGDEMLFDDTLAEAVKEFQRQQGIRATGIVNPITVAALNGEPVSGAAVGRASEADIIANMERWRWMPRELGYNHIFVNIPEFRLQIIEDNRMTHETRVVVGKPETQTPIFSDEVEFVVVNPTWTVPASIALKEYLPKLRDNPYVLQNKGFEVLRNGRVVDPGSIDWWSGVPRNVAIRQPPGERNALGHIKFMFPNGHAVYLHDTPQKKFFAEDVRAFSHGCVRVEDPFALAEMVLGGRNQGWPEERVRRLIGGTGERTITLERHMPVHLGYFTVTADDDGSATRFRDIYGHDARVKKALGL